MEKVKDYLTIDRSKWRTGKENFGSTGEGDTELLNEDGFMCCLGFRCEQMGIPKDLLLYKGTPASISNYDIPDLVDEQGWNLPFCTMAMDLNDENMPRKDREKAIKEHFATKDIIVIFTGKYQ